MTKKDYELVARAIRQTTWMDSAIPSKSQREVALVLADIFQEDNPRFKRDRFLTDCGVKPD